MTHPLLLMLSLERRLIPGYYVLQLLRSKGLLEGNMSLFTFMLVSEKRFMERYILSYREKMPELHEVYTATCAGDGIEKRLGFAGGIPERKVRPIWDAVDSRQFKTALKLSAALLAKHPNSPYALTLKALILEKTGKLDEALSVCLESKELLYSNNLNIIHFDDLTLSTLQIVFQRLDRLDLATSCYEHACGKFPNNLEILMGLFNCYVREYSFVKQQQTAIKMYKIVAEERFLLWAICSIQLQVLRNSGGEKLLSLAEALLKKHIASHSLHEPEAVLIYISILEQQQKYEDALEILSGNLGSLIGIEADKLRMQASCSCMQLCCCC